MSLHFKDYLLFCTVSIWLFLFSNIAKADGNNVDKKPERGWYFYEIKKVIKPPQLGASHSEIDKDLNKAQIKTCQNPDKWSDECGFIDPTKLNLTSNMAFSFEQKEYKGLMRKYALYPNDADAVYNFQKFNMWVLNQAMTASYTWQFNIAQHPDIDANLQVPISQFGIQLIKNIEQSSEKEFWKSLSQTAFFVLITRSDNKICQAQGTILHLLERETGMTVWNVSIDSEHLPGFNHYMNFQTLPKAKQDAIARYIKMDWLPTVYLYMKPMQDNDIGHWIRVTSGITTLDEIKERTIHFVESYKHAIVEGVGESRKIRPDFSVNHLYQLAGEQLKKSKIDNGEEKAK